MVIQMDESFFWHDFPKETIKKLAEEKKINPEIKPSNKQLNEISDDIKILLKSQKIPFLFLSDSVINKKWGVRKVKYNEENLPLYQKAIEKNIEQDKSHKLSVYNFEYGKSKLFGEE